MITETDNLALGCRPCFYQAEPPNIALVGNSAGIGTSLTYPTAAAAQAAATSLAAANMVPGAQYGHRKTSTVYGATNIPPLYAAQLITSQGPYEFHVTGGTSGFVRFNWYYYLWTSEMGSIIGDNPELLSSGTLEAVWERGTVADVRIPASEDLPDVSWPVNDVTDEDQTLIATTYCVIPLDEIFMFYPSV